MLPDRVSNPGPLTYESGTLPIAVVFVYSVLHIKFQGHRSMGSGEDFFQVFTIYGHVGHVNKTNQTFPQYEIW